MSARHNHNNIEGLRSATIARASDPLAVAQDLPVGELTPSLTVLSGAASPFPLPSPLLPPVFPPPCPLAVVGVAGAGPPAAYPLAAQAGAQHVAGADGVQFEAGLAAVPQGGERRVGVDGGRDILLGRDFEGTGEEEVDDDLKRVHRIEITAAKQYSWVAFEVGFVIRKTKSVQGEERGLYLLGIVLLEI